MARTASGMSTELDTAAAPPRLVSNAGTVPPAQPSAALQSAGAALAGGTASTHVTRSGRVAGTAAARSTKRGRPRAADQSRAAGAAPAHAPGAAAGGGVSQTNNPAQSAASTMDKQHQRNVIQMLAPLLSDELARGAGIEGCSDAAVQDASGSAARARSRACAQRTRALPSPLTFLNRLCAQQSSSSLCLSIGVTALAQQLVTAVAAHLECTIPEDLPDKLLRLDAALSLDVPPDAHLLLAELCIDAAATADAAAAAAGGTVAGKRGAAAAAAAGAASEASELVKRKAGLLKRAGGHIAELSLWSIKLRAASAAFDSLAATTSVLAPSQQQLAALRLHTRMHWALYRVACLERDWAASMQELHACAQLLEVMPSLPAAELSTEQAASKAQGPGTHFHATVHLPWCKRGAVISEQAVADAETAVCVHHILDTLHERIEQDGMRAVLGVLAAPMLTDTSRARQLFRAPHEHEAALVQVLHALTDAPQPAHAAPAAPAPFQPGSHDKEAAPASAAHSAEDAPASSARNTQSSRDGSETLAATSGDLSEAETLWARVLCALQCIAVCIPLERTVARGSQLAQDGEVSWVKLKACAPCLL